MNEPAMLTGFAPVVDVRTTAVVLGSFPGAASLAAGHYYAHPRNQFWSILSRLWETDLVAMPYADRIEHLLARRLGLWDTHARCRRPGSLDRDITDVQPNDLSSLLRRAPGLSVIFHNGAESARSMRHTARLGVAVARLPSTSPAHAAWSFERKLQAWRDAFTTHRLS